MESTGDAHQTPVNEARLLAVVRQLAREVGGERAECAVSPLASLEREVGLGSLERVELLLRIENAVGVSLGEPFLQLDTVREMAAAIDDQPVSESAPGVEAAEEPLAAAAEEPSSAATLPEVLLHRALSTPQRLHAALPDEEQAARRTVSFARLLAEAQAVAGGLRAEGVGPGDTVALMLPTGLDFLAAFLGAQIAGAIPVPIYPPVRPNRLEEYAARQSGILRDARARALVTFPRAMPIAALLAPSLPALRTVLTVADLCAHGATLPAGQGRGAHTALIQYTSGSTGDPKGVELTHAQLIANIRAIGAALQLGPRDVVVSWLPLYHDMGLIGAWLACLYHAIPITLIPPLAFLARPERWLTTIHARRATISAAPNFAYELCARKVSETVIDGLDLSSWRCALNGAEPVNPDTLDRFAQRFARAGFRAEALLPVYGLAENAVALCFPPVGRGPRVDRVRRAPFESSGRAEPAGPGETGVLRVVSVGTPLPAHEVRVVDDAGAELPERSVGRLVFRGPSTMSGYFGRPEATAAVTLAGGWVDSGDLAYRADGEIHVAGRRKDLIIKGGRNLVPQELEDAAASVTGIRRGCVVAFGVASETLGTERLVLVAETRVDGVEARRALAGAVTERVAAAVGVPPDEVVLVAPHSVPKTSSGKVRRAAARALFLGGRLGRRPAEWRTRVRIATAQLGTLLRPLGGIMRAPYALYLAIVVAAVAPALWVLAALSPGPRATRAVARWGSRILLWLAGCRLSREGLEHLAGCRGPLVFACNHASYLDSLVLSALLPIDVAFVTKREVLGWPIVGTFARKGAHVGVERWEVQQSLVDSERIGAALRGGDALLFFPEGTFARAAGLRPFRLGAFKAAAEAACPVVPLALVGTRRVLRGDGWLPRPGRIHLWMGAPIASTAQADFRSLVELRDRVAAVIAAHCEEPQLDLVVAGAVRPARE